MKEHEKKRKQKLLRDRVDLQHEMIKKQDQLNEILEKQKKPNKVSRVKLKKKFNKEEITF